MLDGLLLIAMSYRLRFRLLSCIYLRSAIIECALNVLVMYNVY